MPKFRVTKTFSYTEEVVVEADDMAEAEAKAIATDQCDKQGGDHLLACNVVELASEQPDHNPRLDQLYLLGERLRKLYLQLEDGDSASDGRLALEMDNRIGKIPEHQIAEFIENAEALLVRYGQ